MRACFIAIILLLAPTRMLAQDAEECRRPPTEEMLAYRDAYVPQEFHHESFRWEIVDVAVLAAMLCAAGLLSVRHHPKRRLTMLTLIGLAYFGLFRGGCICPVGATTNFCLGLAAPELIGKTVAVLFLLPLVTAFFFGRVFCTSACPLGTIQHVLVRKKAYSLPSRLNGMLRLVPFALLAATAWAALRGGIFLACKLDVYKPIFFSGYAWIGQMNDVLRGTLTEPRVVFAGDLIAWLILIFSLLLGIYVHRPFCRFACPYGVLLGFFSWIGLRKRRIAPESCLNCAMCAGTCPVQAITVDEDKMSIKVSNFHCIQCGCCDEICTCDAVESLFPSTRPGAGEHHGTRRKRDK